MIYKNVIRQLNSTFSYTFPEGCITYFNNCLDADVYKLLNNNNSQTRYNQY